MPESSSSSGEKRSCAPKPFAILSTGTGGLRMPKVFRISATRAAGSAFGWFATGFLHDLPRLGLQVGQQAGDLILLQRLQVVGQHLVPFGARAGIGGRRKKIRRR